MHYRYVFLATGLAFTLAPQLSHAKPAPMVEICHWNANQVSVLRVNENAADAHIRQHGDSYTSTYFPDLDGDGFGDPEGIPESCPHFNYVENSDDCNDEDFNQSPEAEEVCGDGVDNNCDGEVDEGCCPCYDKALLDESYNSFSIINWDFAAAYCRINAMPGSITAQID